MPRLAVKKQNPKKIRKVANKATNKVTNKVATEPKENRLSIRANPNQKNVLAQAAKARHMNVSQFVLQVSLQEAERVIKEETQIIVSPEEYERLCQVMDEPPAPAPRLKAALGKKPLWEV